MGLSLKGSLKGIDKGSIRGALGLLKGSWDLVARVITAVIQVPITVLTKSPIL